MERTIKFICAVVVILVVIYISQWWSKLHMREDFEAKEESYDDDYVNYYNKVFNCKPYYKYNGDVLISSIKKSDFGKNNYILDAGTGVGRIYGKLQNAGLKVIGVDKSDAMLGKAKVNNPTGKFKKGDLDNALLFKQNTFSHIVCLEDTLYHNQGNKLNEIIANFYYWLKPGGILYLHVYEGEELDPCPREYSRRITDKNGKVKSVTFFKDFAHEAEWKGQTYVEKFVLPNKKVKTQKHKLHFGKKDDLLQMMKDNFLKLIDVVTLREVAEDHELYIFKKKKSTNRV